MYIVRAQNRSQFSFIFIKLFVGHLSKIEGSAWNRDTDCGVGVGDGRMIVLESYFVPFEVVEAMLDYTDIGGCWSGLSPDED